MACGSSHWKKYGTECKKCHKTEPEVKLTRSHELTKEGKKTGKIEVLCVECHKLEHPICVLCGKLNSVAKISKQVCVSYASEEIIDVDIPVCSSCYKKESRNERQ
ncbi:MAG: hypothetical protein KGI08_10620 [Thaumarchaeota archaeon]|nr:hypothetical protein [Nitrososphaerota archaeon]